MSDKHTDTTDETLPEDALGELDELMGADAPEPSVQVFIDYDDGDAMPTGVSMSTTANASDGAVAPARADDDDAAGDTHDDPTRTDDASRATDATASAAASAIDRELREERDGFDDAVFRAHPMFAMDDVTFADRADGGPVWDHLSLRCEAGRATAVLVDGDDTRRHNALVALMSGFARPSRGAVMTRTTRFDDISPLELRGHRVGVLLQRCALRDDLSAAGNLEYVMDASNRNYLKPIGVLAQELLTRVGFDGDDGDDAAQEARTRTPVRDLDPMLWHRAAVARAIATDPDIVLADEPTADLDEEDAAVVLDLLRAQTRGESKERAVIVVTASERVAARMDGTIDLR